MENQESKIINLNIKISRELEEQLSKKCKTYGLSNGKSNGKSSLGSLCVYMGFLVLCQAENQIKDIGRFEPKEVLGRIVNNMEIGSTAWCWSLNRFLIPAVKQMTIEQIMLKGLNSIKVENNNEK